MKQQRVIKLKLIGITGESIAETLSQYALAFNDVAEVGFNNRIVNGVDLHHLTYSGIRKKLKLPSQLVISAREKAREDVKATIKLEKKAIKRENIKAKKEKRTPNKVEFSCPKMSNPCIRYDARSYSLKFDKKEVSIATISGRVKAKFEVPEYFKQYLSWNRCSADLFVRNGMIFLSVVVESEVADIVSDGNIIGVDRGIKKALVTSTGDVIDDPKREIVTKRIQKLRSGLRSCGTRSAKRHLRRLGRKENRFRTDVDHCLSRQLVSTCNAGDTIVMEDLTNIRNKRRKTKDLNRALHSWSFCRLERFITYKALARGVEVVHAQPQYTSQTCSGCGHRRKSSRNREVFSCKKCGFTLDADFNAAINIRNRYINPLDQRGFVNNPIVQDGLSKPTSLDVGS